MLYFEETSSYLPYFEGESKIVLVPLVSWDFEMQSVAWLVLSESGFLEGRQLGWGDWFFHLWRGRVDLAGGSARVHRLCFGNAKRDDRA